MSNNKLAYKLCAATVGATLCIALPAAATSWQPFNPESKTTSAIVTDGDADNALLLACGADGKISALIATSTTPLRDLIARNSAYSRSETARIQFGDKPEMDIEMRVIPGADLVETRSAAVGSRLFNAAIRQEPVTLSIRNVSDLTLSLPSPNSSFKAFADTCAKARAK